MIVRYKYCYHLVLVSFLTVLAFHSSPVSSLPFNDNDKSIAIELISKWTSAPLVLEASEFMSKQGNDYFWSFVDLTMELEGNQSDLDLYNFVIQKSQILIQPLVLDMMKFSLSLKSYSVTVEMFLQLSRHLDNKPNCTAFVQLNGQFVCTKEEIENSLKLSKSLEPEIYSFDHIYPQAISSKDLPVVILYGQLGETNFKQLHHFLSKRARKGEIKYILRHHLSNPSSEKVFLAGYGVELDIKSTEYKAVDDTKIDEVDANELQSNEEESKDEIDGFFFHVLRKKYPGKVKELHQFRKYLIDSRNELAPLKVWQLQDLGFQAARRVLLAGDHALKTLRDISQNLPTLARPTVKVHVDNEFRKEIKRNQKEFTSGLGLDPGQSAMFFNGIPFSLEDMDIYDLVEIARKDSNIVNNLALLGLKKEDLHHFVNLATKSSEPFRVIDMRDESVIFINNLETDPEYARWPSSVQDLLRPTFPGMLRYIRKNLFHVVFCIDPVHAGSSEIIQMIHLFHRNLVPVRIGLSLISSNKDTVVDGLSDAGVAIIRGFSYIQSLNGQEAINWLVQLYDNGIPSAKRVVEKFRRRYGDDLTDKVLKEGGKYDRKRLDSINFFNSIGLHRLPQVTVNGVQLDNMYDLESSIVNEIHNQMGKLQDYVMKGQITDSTNIYDFLMSQPHVIPRYNFHVFRDNFQYVNLFKSDLVKELTTSADVPYEKDAAIFITKSMNYMVSTRDSASTKSMTFWIVVDLSTVYGKQLLMEAIEYLSSSSYARIGVIHNTVRTGDDESSEKIWIYELYEAIMKSDDLKKSPHVQALLSYFIEKNTNTISKLEELHEIINLDKLKEVFRDEKFRQSVTDKIEKHTEFCHEVLNLEKGQDYVIGNGRIYGPFTTEDPFLANDLKLIESLALKSYVKAVAEKIASYANGVDSIHTSVVEISSANSNIGHKIVAIINPISKDAQVLAPIIINMLKVTKVDVRVFMNPVAMLSEIPLKSFFRYVLESDLKFSNEGRLISKPTAVFTKIPQSLLLTLNMKIAESWMVEAIDCVHDLDNIRLDQLSQGIKARYVLEYILLEGHCYDSLTGEPPRGLQFVLGTDTNPVVMDTIVMANLGYFQLKANPGLWKLKLRPGRSSDIYKIESHDGEITSTADTVAVTIDGFKGKIVQVKVSKKPGKEQVSLLSEDSDSDEEIGGIWDSISNLVGSNKAQSGSEGKFNETLNIFSVASGHLYERFLRIMMLSVLKHTKNAVKFWFLKNFLSPSFKNSIPIMAEKYNFQYEYVHYKWPRWLRQQTEKQRVIWGYKILFLDVLFPLGIKKIIFVDADQVVRTDMKELMELNLEGAPYGYTPFCDSRSEMDGFRFWNSGYWRSHLAGRKYHISALYVVDLKRFRLLAAGDRLRGQYQMLSADPNSLANLDQDLPNNMIHQVPIKSLPQDWLWCETWCSDRSKTTAKTIDLCNNPLTKEPKLNRAVRIVEEWSEYDKEIKNLFDERKTIDSDLPSNKVNGKGLTKDEL